MTGLKLLWQDLMNIWKVKGSTDVSYISFLMQSIYNILEDVYSVGSITELQTAIDNIGTGAGTIFIESGTYTVSTPIDIDGCGSLVIYGHGDNTILQAADGINIFNITCCQSLLVKTLKLDINNYTADTQAVIVNETNNNVVSFIDVTIDGAAINGIGIELQSNNCNIARCNITDCKKGIYINNSNNHTISNNTITGHVEYGIHADTSNYLTITTNTCGSNTLYGVYFDTITYSNLSGNICNSNKTGIYLTASPNNTVSNNSCSSNSENGLYLTGSSYNTISGNTLENNDSNTANPQAGLFITTDSDYNTISSNSVNNNNNAGAGVGYGIYIATATCNENVVSSNNANGNDIDYEDEGTATTIIYYVQNQDELQDAIDSIGTGTGTVVITVGNIAITTAIDVDGGGAYIIEGQGDNTILTIVGDISAFSVRDAKSCLISNMKIDSTGHSSPSWIDVISIIETSDNPVTVDNITFVGGGDGQGVNIVSDNCTVNNCRITSLLLGIFIQGTKCTISNNKIEGGENGIWLLANSNVADTNIVNGCSDNGYYIAGYYNILSNSIATGCLNGVYVGGRHSIITGCVASGNTQFGIEVKGADDCLVSNNLVDGNDSNSANNTGGVFVYSGALRNVIDGNVITNNNNTGVGQGIGIYIGKYGLILDSEDNIVKNNTIYGNDVQWLDEGINTNIEYRCSSATDIQQAIDSIAAKTGTIGIVSGTITLSATIDIDGGGDYIVEGEGIGSVIDCAADRTAFNITSARSCILRNFKVDATDLTTVGKEIIDINEGANSRVIVDNIDILGDGTNGIGITCTSDNITIHDCYIHSVDKGINIEGTADSTILYANRFSANATSNIVDAGSGTIIMQGGWSGWFDDGANFRVTVVDGLITAVDNSTAGGHNP